MSYQADLATAIAGNVGVTPPSSKGKAAIKSPPRGAERSPALSMRAQPDAPPPSIASRKVAVLLAAGVRGDHVRELEGAMMRGKGCIHTVALEHGTVPTTEGVALEVDDTLLTSASVQFDGVFVPDGVGKTLADAEPAVRFVAEA